MSRAGVDMAPFGHTRDGQAANLYTLRNRNGVLVRITNYGGTVVEILAPCRERRMDNIVLGFSSLAPYLDRSPYFGALIGRYGNRIAEGTFALDGVSYRLPVNNGPNHLHGGEQGFDKVLWDATPSVEGAACCLDLHHCSRDGDQGYPGNLEVKVRYVLTDDALEMRFEARTDRATPVNLTNHTYFNLAGQGAVLEHMVLLRADRYTPVDAHLIPTGELAPVAGTPFDFRTARRIGERIGEDHPQLLHAGGYDHNFVLDGPAAQAGLGGYVDTAGHTLPLAARVHEPRSGRVLELFTEEPGVQFYTGNFLDGEVGYPHRGGFCLEPQHFPDSPNQPHFPNTILRPGETYRTVSAFRFGIDTGA